MFFCRPEHVCIIVHPRPVAPPKLQSAIQSTYQSQAISLLTLHVAGWCHSALEFITSCRLLLTLVWIVREGRSDF